MQFVNPSKYIRQAIDLVVSPLPCYSGLVPKTVIPTPTKYALITSEGINETANCKNGNEWLISLNLELYHVGKLGQDYSAVMDDMLLEYIPKLKSLQSPHIIIKNVTIAVRTLDFNTSTNSINRKIVTLDIWCDYGN